MVHTREMNECISCGCHSKMERKSLNSDVIADIIRHYDCLRKCDKIDIATLYDDLSNYVGRRFGWTYLLEGLKVAEERGIITVKKQNLFWK